jgi:large subunit ribosomal protein L21
MYAIVEIAGQQFKVAKDQKVFVHRLGTEEGNIVSFDNVLLLDNDGEVTIGAPAINGASVEVKVLRHLKGDKVIVFKKKRRKGYRVKNGHRQALTEILIENISASGAKKTAPKKKAAPKASTKGDDLKKIEGIGPKIADTLAAAGITSFAELAKTESAKISEIIADVRGNHVTDTWPAQAQMAADGKWDELKVWQDELKGGIAK